MMKKINVFSIGLLTILAFIVLSPSAHAKVCSPGNIETHYEGIYCGIKVHDNEKADKEIIAAVAKQFEFGRKLGNDRSREGFDKEVIEEILNDTLCTTISRAEGQKLERYPEELITACTTSGQSVSDLLGKQTIFNDVKNAYKKEKALQHNSKSLEFKFKASEQYWDGAIGPGPDAPFDLIVDLNLIEIVLFGSKAQWMNDVFMFPRDEDEDGEEDEIPLDELLPDGEGVDDEGVPVEDEGDPGLLVDEEEEEEGPDCVPPDHPDADPDYDNPLCGNGVVDVLMGEICDDGNKESGDGCNQYCQEENFGSDAICQDPEAVTFRSPDDGDGDGDGDPLCPPGTVPSRIPTVEGEEAGAPLDAPQLNNYPGPFLGGTLKQFPESTQPECPPGTSPLGITIAGETHTVKDGSGNTRCLPLEFCADPNDARDFLFGEGWEDNEDLGDIPLAIEAMFCVNIIKNTRPLSPYQLIEGCVDCHITAMVDALERALQGNVSPLANSTSSFGISSRYGPNFAFNLSTAVKSNLKYETRRDTKAKAIQRFNRAVDESEAENEIDDPTISPQQTPTEQLQTKINQTNERQTNLLSDTNAYRLSSGVVSDQEVAGRIGPLLRQMQASFENIQSQYEIMISGTYLNKKKVCK